MVGALREDLGTQLSQAGKAVSQTAGGPWAPGPGLQPGWPGGEEASGLGAACAGSHAFPGSVCPQWHKGKKLLLGQGSPRMSEITCPEGSRGVQSHSSPPQRSGVGTAEAWPPMPDQVLGQIISMLTHLILRTVLCNKYYYYSHFTNKKRRKNTSNFISPRSYA